eukprot:4071867-Karenia_brevis.AAC.1
MGFVLFHFLTSRLFGPPPSIDGHILSWISLVMIAPSGASWSALACTALHRQRDVCSDATP